MSVCWARGGGQLVAAAKEAAKLMANPTRVTTEWIFIVSPPVLDGPDFLDDIFGVSGVVGVVDDDSETIRGEAFGDGGANST